MSRKDYFNQIERGAQLVILDDLVIDVKDFIVSHPGGKFVI